MAARPPKGQISREHYLPFRCGWREHVGAAGSLTWAFGVALCKEEPFECYVRND
jgi:hypothetical protein